MTTTPTATTGSTGSTRASGTGPALVDGPHWTTVCSPAQIVADTGVTALVGDVQVAVFHLADGSLAACDNHDPCSGANVLSRGILGDVDGRPFVASPVHKQRFDLLDGHCLDEPEVRVDVHAVRCIDDEVQVALTGAVAGAPRGR